MLKPVASATLLLVGMVIGILFGAHLQMRGAVAAGPCKPSATPAAPASGHVIFSASGTAGGNQKLDTDTFRASGPFNVVWSASVADPSAFGGLIIVQLWREDHLGWDIVAQGTGTVGHPVPGGTTSERHMDCSGGCYFTIQTQNMKYSVQVVQ